MYGLQVTLVKGYPRLRILSLPLLGMVMGHKSLHCLELKNHILGTENLKNVTSVLYCDMSGMYSRKCS